MNAVSRSRSDHVRAHERKQLCSWVTGKLLVYHGRLFEGSQVVSREKLISGPTLARTLGVPLTRLV